MAMESVRINGVSVLSGLHLEKLQELGTRKTVRNGEVSLLSTGVRKAGFDSTRNSTLTQSTSSLARAFPQEESPKKKERKTEESPRKKALWNEVVL